MKTVTATVTKTFRTDGQSLWDNAIKFTRWHHHRAHDEICYALQHSFGFCHTMPCISAGCAAYAVKLGNRCRAWCLSVWLSICLSVCHVRGLCQNEYRKISHIIIVREFVTLFQNSLKLLNFNNFFKFVKIRWGSGPHRSMTSYRNRLTDIWFMYIQTCDFEIRFLPSTT